MLARNNYLIIVLMWACSVVSFAAPLPRYQVEMILFKRTDFNTADTAQKTTPFAMPAQHRLLIAQDQANSTDQSFVKCRPNQFTLGKEALALSQQPHLQIIDHFAWQANIDELNQSLPIVITAGSELQAETKPIPELQGTLRIKKDAFFHIKTDFALTVAKNASAISSADELAFYSEHGEYALLDNELHYFDSEHLGIIMKITRL